MTLKEEFCALQDAWNAPPIFEQQSLSEEDHWHRMLAQCRERARRGCATTAYTLVTEIDSQETYDAYMAMRERLKVRLLVEGLTIQHQKDVKWEATYMHPFGEEMPTRYSVWFTVTWR